MTDNTPLSRRCVLQTLGVGFFASQPALARSQTSLYQSPPASVTPTTVDVREQNHHILDDAWIAHTFGFITENSEPSGALAKVRDAATYTFQLNGTEVDDFHRGWESITEEADGRYSQMWRYVIPPPSPGEHRYSLEITFDDPVQTSGNSTRVWNGKYRFTGTYTFDEADAASRNPTRAWDNEGDVGKQHNHHIINESHNG